MIFHFGVQAWEVAVVLGKFYVRKAKMDPLEGTILSHDVIVSGVPLLDSVTLS